MANLRSQGAIRLMSPLVFMPISFRYGVNLLGGSFYKNRLNRLFELKIRRRTSAFAETLACCS